MLFRKSLSIIITAAISIGCGANTIPYHSAAVAEDYSDNTQYECDGWIYELIDGGAKVVGHIEADDISDEMITLPTVLDDHKVIYFEKTTFDNCHIYDASIFINDNTAQFDDDFLAHNDISFVHTKDFVYAFNEDRRSDNEVSVYQWKHATTQDPDISYSPEINSRSENFLDVEIPEKVAGCTVTLLNTEGEGAFCNVNNIGKVTLPDTIESIDTCDFANSSVTSLNIPKSIMFIPDNCFMGCTFLNNVSFHDDLLIVSATAFPDSPNVIIPEKYMDSYSSATIAKNIQYGTKCVNDWILYFQKEREKELKISLLKYIGTEKSLTIPDKVGDYAINFDYKRPVLEENNYVEEVALADGMKIFPRLGSSTVTKVTIPETISVLDWQFNDCTSLSSAVIPPNVTQICQHAFHNCKNLKEVIFQGDEMTIGSTSGDDVPFTGTSITRLELPGNCTFSHGSMPETLEEISFRAGNKVFFKGGVYATENLNRVIFDPDINEVTIGSCAFSNSKIEEIVFPNGKVSINSDAFRGCSKLKKLVFNGEVEISANAFSECPELETVVFGDKCNVAELAFCNCPKLNEVDFDLSQNISGRCFNGCNNLFYINGIEVVSENSSEIAPELKDYFFKNCQTAQEVGFVNRFTMNRVNEIVAEIIDDSMSDMEKIRSIHDWICNNTVYDNGNEGFVGNHVDSAIFWDGVAVCEGYSRAYNLLLHKAGIECCYVCTKAHAWNLVKLGDDWFHVDTTWDDGDAISYNCFLRGDSEITSDSKKGFKLESPSALHSFQPTKLPSCSKVMGDTDNDSKITFNDVSAIYSSIVSKEEYTYMSDLSFDGRLSSADVAAALNLIPDIIHTMGDVNGDGKVDSSDASDVLAEYAGLSTDSDQYFSSEQIIAGDLNSDGKIDSSDASRILGYYSYISTGGDDDIVSFLK